jgi:hypothetical protein
MEVNNILDKVKELVRKGNVSKIVLRRKGEVIVSIPVNVGIVGAVVGITAAKWAILAAALATVGFGCSVEIVKDDGEIVNVVTEDDTAKAKDTATNFVDQVKDAATNFISQIKETEEPAEDADFEQVVDESEPKE